MSIKYMRMLCLGDCVHIIHCEEAQEEKKTKKLPVQKYFRPHNQKKPKKNEANK